MPETAIGPRLRELREAAGLTQAALALEAGVSRRVLEDAEQGQGVPVWETLCKLADALGVGLDELRKPARRAPKRGRGRPPKKGNP